MPRWSTALRTVGDTLRVLLCAAMLLAGVKAAPAPAAPKPVLPPLAAPANLAPAGSSESLSPQFTWTEVTGATRYEFELRRADGTRVFHRDGIKTNSFRLPGEPRLIWGSTYNFSVRASDHATQRVSEWVRSEFTVGQHTAAPTVFAAATPAHLMAGEQTVVSWSSTDAQSVVIDGVGLYGATGSVTLMPATDTTYTVTAFGVGGQSTVLVPVTVNFAPIARALATPAYGPSPLQVVLDATASSDDTTITAYEWDVHDDGSIDATGPVANLSITERGTHPIRLIVTDDEGANASSVVEVEVTSPMPSASLTASPSHVVAGQGFDLTWHTEDATDVAIEPGVGAVSASGTLRLEPGDDTTYTVVARNESGVASAAAFVSVNTPPEAKLTALPAVGRAPLASILDASESFDADGRVSTYAWRIDGQAVDGSSPRLAHTFSEPGTHTATVTVHDNEGAADTAEVVVVVSPPAPTASITLASQRILTGGATVLSWVTTGADSVIITPGLGPVPPSGEVLVSPVIDTTYTVLAVGPGGEIAASSVLTVCRVEQPAVGSFAWDWVDAVPTNATVRSLDETRFAVISGQVLDVEGGGIAGARVSVVSAPEYGTAASGPDGAFAIALEGGRTVSLRYEADGYLSATRQIDLGNNEVATAPEVRLVALDQLSTEIVLNGNAEDEFVHTGRTIDDARGRRAATVVFAGDTIARDASGNVLPSITVRATEYATPTAMPAPLPSASAFTYCVELSCDEATSVAFSKPVTLWVDDFIGFGPGVVVPVGSFDRAANRWIGEQNGVTVRLIDVDGDGAIDAVDLDDDGLADDIDGDGATDDETEGVENGRFQPGAVAWRAQVSHFTPIDLNWPWWIPEDARDPDGVPTEPNPNVTTDKVTCGSYADPSTGVLEDDIPIPGTGMVLHYSSDRTSGFKTRITVPFTRSSVPTVNGSAIPAPGVQSVPLSLMAAKVMVFVGGRTLDVPVDSSAMGSPAVIDWDGRDARGQMMTGRVKARVRLEWEYPLVYAPTRVEAERIGASMGVRLKSLPMMWGLPGAARGGAAGVQSQTPAIRAREFDIEIIRPGYAAKTTAGTLVGSSRGDAVAEGWTLSPVHQMDVAAGGPVNLGGGGTLDNTVGVARYLTYTDGRSGLMPSDAVFDGQGRLWATGTLYSTWTYSGTYIVDRTTGTPTTVGLKADTLATSSDGRVWATMQGRVMRYEGDRFVAVACSPSSNSSFTAGMSAMSAPVWASDFAPESDGGGWILDSTAKRLYRLQPDGTVHPAAGFGSTTPAQGVVAVECRLDDPRAVAVSPTGECYLSDRGGTRVWRIDATGVLHHVAGTGVLQQIEVDGLEATAAPIEATGMSFTRDGRLVMSSFSSGRVYGIDDSGRLRVRLGARWGAEGSPLPGAPSKVTVGRIRGAAVDADGVLVAATDTGLVTVRMEGEDSRGGAQRHVVPVNPRLAHVFDESGRHLGSIDPSAETTLVSVLRDEQGRVSAVMDRFGTDVRLERDAAGRVTTVRSMDGAATQLTYDSRGHLKSVVGPDGALWQLSHSNGGLLDSTTDPLGRIATHRFDSSGRLTSAVDADGFESTLYSKTDASGNREFGVSTGPQSRKTTYDPTDGSARFFNSAGFMLGSASTSADGATRINTSADGTRHEARTGADTKWGLPFTTWSKTTLPSGLAAESNVSRTYTTIGGKVAQITEAVTTAGRTTSVTDDVMAGMTRVTSPAGRVVRSTYSTATLLPLSVSTPGMHAVTYSHDSRGRLTTVTVGERNTAYSYDASGNVAAITAPDGSRSGFEYDAVGRTTAQLRPDGTRVQYRYDASGAMTSLVTPAGATHSFAGTWRGAPASYTAPLSGTYVYQYDQARRLSSVTAPSGKRVENVYTGDHLASTRFPDGEITYSHSP